MSSQTNFEQFVKELTDFRQISETEILHMAVQVAAKMYRFLTKDLDALDIVIDKNGKVELYKSDKQVKISKKVKQLIVWAVFRSMENKIFLNYRIN
ncbi:MAG: hypothetical protein UT12_C0019G0004 [Candidatus Curtissbacteria bacterium GW2011_GWC2_38_9]|uniref:Transcription factor NusA N-terminal domain-containing protein n=3 Tax=Candidatus Curtissiibacteriota TaxID=1752717 RepID=A0A1F5HTA4_9BACT|nr:MAG: hypothetical protein UT12_C0019G0004 [Candidatus Curtissbacteria bacterium GW2011_GWC2_38_9]KKS03255.1 MAG: hypothetical protein UU56_C0021G0003 [Candidatus Curtissbacteria bacterium GW2011_GWA2_41_24]OGE07225.1 MAG: hypothetical protein A2W70_02205 [Candidatus Curtissbacteria bacterium RIFCSPLOWO2_02_41_11]